MKKYIVLLNLISALSYSQVECEIGFNDDIVRFETLYMREDGLNTVFIDILDIDNGVRTCTITEERIRINETKKNDLEEFLDRIIWSLQN